MGETLSTTDWARKPEYEVMAMSSTSEISKYLKIDTNVVRNSVAKDIQLSKDYIDEFGIGELDWKSLKGSTSYE